MAQSALTVTAANPTPPTNLVMGGWTPPCDPAQAIADDGITMATPNARDLTASNGMTLNETSLSRVVFAVKTAVAGTAGFASNDHEGRGNETLYTKADYNPAVYVPIALTTVGCGPALTVGTSPQPNALSASGAANAATPTITSASGASNVSGAGTTLLTVTGTGYTPSSKVYVNGILQNSNYVSATSLTVTNAQKKLTSGTLPVIVTNGYNGPASASANWTFT